MPEYEQELLWNHTGEIRGRRQTTNRSNPSSSKAQKAVPSSDVELTATSDAGFDDLDEDLGIDFDFAMEEENADLSISALLGKLTHATDVVGGVEDEAGSDVGSE